MPLSSDGKAHLRHVQLVTPEIKMIEYLAERGGEIPWDWSKVAPAAQAMIADLINKGLVIDREYVSHAAQLHGELQLALTEQGRQVAEQIELSKKVSAST